MKALGKVCTNISLPIIFVALTNFPVFASDKMESLSWKDYSPHNAIGIEPEKIPNFQEVTGNIYRGGRPATGDLAAAQRDQGIRTVLNLENDTKAIREDQKTAMALGMRFISRPMSAYERPNDSQVDQILAALQDASNFPILIHCRRGQDRTGVIIGLYRVLEQGWLPSQAYDEMLRIGFHPQFRELDNYFRDRTGFH